MWRFPRAQSSVWANEWNCVDSAISAPSSRRIRPTPRSDRDRAAPNQSLNEFDDLAKTNPQTRICVTLGCFLAPFWLLRPRRWKRTSPRKLQERRPTESRSTPRSLEANNSFLAQRSLRLERQIKRESPAGSLTTPRRSLSSNSKSSRVEVSFRSSRTKFATARTGSDDLSSRSLLPASSPNLVGRAIERTVNWERIDFNSNCQSKLILSPTNLTHLPLRSSKAQLNAIANKRETLIPIRIDIEHATLNLHDTFTWNLRGTALTLRHATLVLHADAFSHS